MIQKGILSEDVSYMIIDRQEIGKYSLYMTRSSKECKIMQIGNIPTEKEYQSFDSSYKDQVHNLINSECINFKTHSLFIIICGELTLTEKLSPKEDINDFGYFPWKKPKMKLTQTGKEIMDEYFIIHKTIKHKKRTFYEILLQITHK